MRRRHIPTTLALVILTAWPAASDGKPRHSKRQSTARAPPSAKVSARPVVRAATPHALLRGPVTPLAGLVAEAIGRHPNLQHRRQLRAASAEVASRVGSLPDPILAASPSNFRTDVPSLSSSPMTGVVVGLSQKIPLPGKLRRRAAVARAAEQVALQEVLVRRAAIALQVRERYWSLHLAERTLAIIDLHVRIVDQLVGVVTARFGTGNSNQQDVLQAQVAHSRARAWLTEAEQGVITARRQLNSAAGRAPAASLGLTAAPPAPTAVVTGSAKTSVAERLLLKNNPRLGAAGARKLLAERALDEARYDRWPDLGVGLSYRFRGATPGDASDGADMVSGLVHVSLPVFLAQKQAARVRERGHQLAAAKAHVADTQLRVTTALRSLRDQLARLNRELALVKKELLPRADAALNASIADYQFAKVGFVAVLQNWQTKLDVELWHERLLVQRAINLARTRALTERQRERKPRPAHAPRASPQQESR